jgi:predicted TIM-barrel fold metal-dependent hydrolase
MKEIGLNDIKRRKFISGSALIMGGILSPVPLLFGASALDGKDSEDQGSLNNDHQPTELDIHAIPNFCSHEHWGSIDAIGAAPEQDGFRCDTTAGARPGRATSIWDLVLDPYVSGWMSDIGLDPNALAIAAGHPSQLDWWEASPQAALKGFKSTFRSSMMTGGFQCTRRGILKLYGNDIGRFELQDWREADMAIRKRYSHIFSWYQEAMRTAHFSELIRPVHPEYYVQEESQESSRQEHSFTHTILRIDPFLDLWRKKSPRRDALSKIAQIEPGDAQSWREFIKRIFDLAAKNHTAGIKQLQAYRRSLDYQYRTDAEVTFRGELNESDITCFQDWVMHECCKQAHERNWVHQVHVGTNNIAHSSPLPLEALANRYPQMNIVMIHCWPFLKEAGWLAKAVRNMHIDTCWLPVLNPAFLREALTMWLNYVPVHKIMLAHDSTHVEMATGSSLFTREILTDTLLYQQKTLRLPVAELRRYAADMLHNNAVRLYKIGTEFNA